MRGIVEKSFRTLIVMTLLVMAAIAFARPGSLDDTIGIANLEPDTVDQLACQPIYVDVELTLTDARNFTLRFDFDPTLIQLTAVIPGSHPDIHILPHNISGNVITVDGFFNPNFTGTTTGFTFCFQSFLLPDTSTTVHWLSGQGFSGTYDNAVPISFSGDSALIQIEGTPPLAPDSLVIRRLAVPAYNDSIEVLWTPTYYDLLGDTVINPLYVVYREDVINNPGVFDSVGATSDTFYYSPFIQLNFNPPYDSLVVNDANFQVRARKTQP